MSELPVVPLNFSVIKNNIDQFPLKCRLFMSLLLNNSSPTRTIQIPKTFKKNYESFTLIFKNFNSDQKIYFIQRLSHQVGAILENKRKLHNQTIHQIETSCEIKTATMGLSFWERKNFKYSYSSNSLRLITSKKQQVIDLKNYLMRKSQSEKDGLVLQAIEKIISPKMAKITIKFNNHSIFVEIYNNIRNHIIQLTLNKLEVLLKEDIKKINVKEMNSGKKQFTILTSKTMTDYFNRKQKLMEKLHNSKFKRLMVHNKNDTKVYRSQHHKNCFYLQQIITANNIDVLKDKIKLFNDKAKQRYYSCQILQNFTKNITANYYRMEMGRKQYQFVVIVQKLSTKDQYHQTMKTATNFYLDIAFQFADISLKLVQTNVYSLQMNAILHFTAKKGSSTAHQAANFLIQMIGFKHAQVFNPDKSLNTQIFETEKDQFSSIDSQEPYQRRINLDLSLNDQEMENRFQENIYNSSSKSGSQESKEDQQFFTAAHIDQGQMNEVFYSIERTLSRNSMEHFQNQYIKQDKFVPNTEETVTQQVNYLRVKAFCNPQPKSQLKKIKQHYLFVDWKRSSKGGVICINQEVVNKQKKVIKLIFTRLGNNLFNGNGIMNVSLPIQLNKPQSSLISIAKNLTFAPIFIEPSIKLSPLQKMKQIILFQISINALSLSTEKPFNPILGQTYQGVINGCPVFLQQISHHPPISSVYMIGRGFKIYGNIQLQISLRLNYARGSNDAWMTIEYDDGHKVMFSMPIMIINGLIVGERSIYYDSTVYFADESNLLITQMTYNYNSKRGLFSFKTQSPDYLFGEIYQVTPTFMQKFIASKRKLSPKKDQSNKCLSTVSGEWNGKISIDDCLVYNFETQLPVQLVHCSYPLPSDSVFRVDVIQLSKGDAILAQQQKDKLQQNQRRQKRLRTSNKNAKKY